MPPRLPVLEQLVAGSPNDPFPYYALAQEYRGLGRTDDALATFDTLAQRFAQYIPTYLMAAQTALAAKDIPNARAWALRGINVARTDPHAQGELQSFLATLPPP